MATERANKETDKVHNREADRIKTYYAKWEGTLNKANPGYRMGLRERDRALQCMLRDRFPHPLSRCRVLDIGCGLGGLLGWFHKQGVPAVGLFGIDLLSYRLKAARETYPAFTFIEGNAEQLDFSDAWFSLVTVFTVFSSILDDGMARRVAQNISRVLAPDGAVVWYDMRYPNPWNPGVKAMTKRRIRALFPRFQMELRQLTLLPPVARHLGPLTEKLYSPLQLIPVLRSHYLGLLRPPQVR
jgi:ubiquinone/menaquinone biosynthesis C-methylase UbiE